MVSLWLLWRALLAKSKEEKTTHIVSDFYGIPSLSKRAKEVTSIFFSALLFMAAINSTQTLPK